MGKGKTLYMNMNSARLEKSQRMVLEEGRQLGLQPLHIYISVDVLASIKTHMNFPEGDS